MATALFLGIFLINRNDSNNTILRMSAAGIILSLLVGILNHIWLKRPLLRISNLILQLTRGKMPQFTASKTKDEIGDLERQLDKHVKNLREISKFSRSLSSGDFTVNYTKLGNEDGLGESLLTLMRV